MKKLMSASKEFASSSIDDAPDKSSAKENANKSTEFTPEEYLLASMRRFRKEESQNQSAVEQLAQSLASPFKISEKPCEKQRAEVLRCYQQLLSKCKLSKSTDTANGRLETKENEQGNTIDNWPAQLSVDEVIRLPLFKCYEFCQKYDQCINVEVIQAHYSETADELVRPSTKDNGDKSEPP